MGQAPTTSSPEPSQAESYFLPQPLDAPTFALTSHLGKPISSRDFPERFLAVFFGYTFCPDVCPMTLTNLTEAFRLLGEDGERVQVLLVSVDPARDTPEQLARYLSNFHPSFLGLTGTEGQIRHVADGFGAYFQANGEGERYTVDHTARIFIVSPDHKIPLTYPVTATAVEIARDLAELLSEEGATEKP